MNMRRLLLVAFLLAPAPAQAAVSYVDNLAQCAGLAPCYPTIMGAVEASVPPATIEVFPGVYHEAVAVVFKGPLELRSYSAGSRPVIVAPAFISAVQVVNSPGFRLAGFIIEAPGGFGVAVAGGASSPVILEDNYIRSGRGVFFNSVTWCVARGNIIDGGLLDMGGSRQCVLEGNTLRGRITFDEGLGCGPRGNQVRDNVVLDGGIALSGRCVETNVIQSNLLAGGSIEVSGDAGANLIRGNVVRGGGIALNRQVAVNTVEDNFVSGSPADGIRVEVSFAGNNLIQRNTLVESAGCDLNDLSRQPYTPNTWRDNRYRTACGAAAEQESSR